MRICFVIPSDEFATSAGARIRIDRFAEVAPLFGASVSMKSMRSFHETALADDDVYIFVKTYNADSLMLADRLKALGRPIGVDLFDDYFSQADDVRMSRFRRWLRKLGPMLDFALCSTEWMCDVFRTYQPDIPPLLLPDPSPAYDPRRVLALLNRKRAIMQGSRDIRILWFGIGDNPFFPVGIHDLRAHAEEIGRVAREGWNVKLTIMTNARALTSNGLAMLRRLPIPFTYQEWSSEAEAAAVQDADVCFLPVGSQAFSRAKSLNRAITALDAGCQVVNAGYPLYRPLGPFIYRDFATLLADAEADRLLHRSDTIDAFSDALNRHANPYAGMEALAAFLRRMGGNAVSSPDQPPRRSASLVRSGAAKRGVLIHGVKSSMDVHKFVVRIGALSIKSPVTALKANFDARFDWSSDKNGLRVLLYTPLIENVRKEIRADFRDSTVVGEREFLILDPNSDFWSDTKVFPMPYQTPYERAIGYRHLVEAVERASRRLFAGDALFVNEETIALP